MRISDWSSDVCSSDLEIFHEGGPKSARPPKRGVIGAIVRNPYAGHYETDITPMMEALKPLGMELTKRLVAGLGGDPGAVEAYGKGAIVGANGELEHGALARQSVVQGQTVSARVDIGGRRPLNKKNPPHPTPP